MARSPKAKDKHRVSIAEAPLWNNKIYRGLAGRIRKRAAARNVQKFELMIKKVAASKSPHVLADYAVRKRHWRGKSNKDVVLNQAHCSQNHTEKSQPKTQKWALSSPLEDASKSSKDCIPVMVEPISCHSSGDRGDHRGSRVDANASPHKSTLHDKENVDLQRRQAATASRQSVDAVVRKLDGSAARKTPRVSKIPRASPRKRVISSENSSPAKGAGPRKEENDLRIAKRNLRRSSFKNPRPPHQLRSKEYIHKSRTSDRLPAASEGRLTVLISRGVPIRSQRSKQEAALDLLRDLSIPTDVVDGMDPSQREVRDAFFAVR